MEYSRKKITDEQIYAEEKKLSAAALAIVEKYEGKFASLGYVLETELIRDNDSGDLTPEERETIRSSKIEEGAGDYTPGYTSVVKITVKREKTDADLAEEAAENEPEEDENLSAEELELRQNELVLEKAKREQERSVAFTTMLFVRVYKTFWKETVSISESADEIKADLEEFFTVLEEKAQNPEVETEQETEAE